MTNRDNLCLRCGERIPAKRRDTGYCTQRCAVAQAAEDLQSAQIEEQDREVNVSTLGGVVGTTRDGRKIWAFWDTNIPHGAIRVQLETAPGSDFYDSGTGRLFNTQDGLDDFVRQEQK